MDKFILPVVLLLATSAFVKPQYNTCRKNHEFCLYDSECCTNYCEYALGEDGTYGLCTEWPFPNCGRDGDDCLHHTDCCHGFCAHEENRYATFNYCTNGPLTLSPPISFAPLPSSPFPAPSDSAPAPVAETPISTQFSPPSPPTPEISPYFDFAPGPLADSPVTDISPVDLITAPTPAPAPAPHHHGKMKKHRTRKWKHAKAPKAPCPGREF